MSSKQDIHSEVTKYLHRRGPAYEGFLEDIVRDLIRFRDAGNSGSVYRIYTRADKQAGGRRLKSVDGIVKKLRQWRLKEPAAHASAILDIIGITIVGYFKGDMDVIFEALESNTMESFTLVSREPKKFEGYYAEHFVVQRRAKRKGFAEEPLCEIQVKTLLNDGWAAKTHDMSYKSRISIDPQIKRQISLLGKSVENLEQQSDILRDMIRRSGELDQARRDTAALQLALALTNSVGVDQNTDIVRLANQIVDSQVHLSSCADTDEVLSSIIETWRALLRSNGHCRLLCRCIVLLAMIRDVSDLDADAIDAVDAWVDGSEPGRDEAGALAFKALAHWVFGQHEEAVATGEAVVQYTVGHALPSQTGKLNLAYYMAERLFNGADEGFESDLEKIQTLTQGFEISASPRTRNAQLDSLGAIKIMTAKDRGEVYEGQSLCQKAREQAIASGEDSELFDLFYDLHERRAAHKLMELR